LGLKSQDDWRRFARTDRKPRDIPLSPQHTYKEHWKGWGDWLGTGKQRNMHFRDFESARDFVRSLSLHSLKEWQRYAVSVERPPDVPSHPDRAYIGLGWAGFDDWLGTGKVSRRAKTYRDFEAARQFARNLQLNGQRGWFAFAKSGRLPADIPTTPHRAYKNTGWLGWGDWLGTGCIAPRLRVYRPYEEARSFVRALKLSSAKEWNAFVATKRLPSDIPATPSHVYRGDGWAGFDDWLGTIPASHQDERRSEDSSAPGKLSKSRGAE
jgi:hypothetical protein